FAQAGESGIPADPLRISDVLQDHGFALPTPDGKAIHRIEVIDGKGKFQHTFTCLKMQTRRLWTPVKLPQNFFGVIRDLEEDAQRETGSGVTETVTPLSGLQSVTVKLNAASIQDEPAETGQLSREAVEPASSLSESIEAVKKSSEPMETACS